VNIKRNIVNCIF